jgi:integrase
MTRRRKLWREAVGVRPYRVAAFERRPGGPLWLRWRDPSKPGGYGWEALKHNDREKAVAKALKLAGKLQAGEEAIQRGETTLAELFVAYERHRTPRKSETEQEADRRRSECWTRRLGAERPVTKITLADWESFIDDRSSGRICPHGAGAPHQRPDKSECPGPRGRPVRARTVQSDCVWLRLVVSWGTKWRDRSGKVLVAEDVLSGFPLPKERNPRRPVASTDRLEALRKAIRETEAERDAKRRAMLELPPEDRKRVPDPIGDLAEFLEIAAGTGRRLSAICNLRWEDVTMDRSPDAPHGAIRWRAAHDKAGKEAVVPMGPQVRAAIDRLRKRRPGVGEAPLFPHPKDPSKPVTRFGPIRWLQNAEKLAGLEPQEGSLWHAYRRAWATQRKHLPAVDVAKAGGWATVAMVTDIYQQADQETTLKVVLGGAEIREVGGR